MILGASSAEAVFVSKALIVYNAFVQNLLYVLNDPEVISRVLLRWCQRVFLHVPVLHC